MFVGLVDQLGLLVPHYTALAGAIPQRAPDLDDFVSGVFVQQGRFIGAGTIGVAAIWTLLKIIGPIIAGIRSRACRQPRAQGRARRGPADHRARHPDRHRRCLHPCLDDPNRAAALRLRQHRTRSPPIPAATIMLSIIYILIAGVVIAAVCGYMAGLIGASNSPISGVGILSVLGISLILALLFPQRDRRRIQVARRLRAVRHGGGLRRRDHLEQQPSGSQDRPARRGDALAAAGRSGARRHLRRDRHPAGARPAEHRLHASRAFPARKPTRSPPRRRRSSRPLRRAFSTGTSTGT